MAQRRRVAIGALSIATVAVVGSQLTGRGPVPEALPTSPVDETWPTPSTRVAATTVAPTTSTAPTSEAVVQSDVDAFLAAVAEDRTDGVEPEQSEIDAFWAAVASAQSTSTTRDPACSPNYAGCVPIDSDVDCLGGNGDGPSYAEGTFTVLGDDIYGLDPDGDLIACEPI